jgi:hypothetical protein
LFENGDNIHSLIDFFDNSMNDLPPLKALRAFEACYRLGSYTRAAARLNVQQPAISHQIRLLESDLGVKLFVKRGAAMHPTDRAHDYYRTISLAFGDIERASARLRRQGKNDEITLATYPGIASFWLLSRLTTLNTSLSTRWIAPFSSAKATGRGSKAGFSSLRRFSRSPHPN